MLTVLYRVYATRALLDALAPLIGAADELGGKAVGAGWADGASKEKIETWAKKGFELRDEVDKVVKRPRLWNTDVFCGRSGFLLSFVPLGPGLMCI